MSYNGSGTFTLSATLAPNALATAGSVNAILQNIATYGLSLALVKDGQSAMTGQFKAYAGSLSAPGLSFAAEPTSGIYRKSSGVLAIVIGGTEVGTWSFADGCTAGMVGEIKMFGGLTLPDGWLTCDGSARSRTSYSALFAKIGTNFGAGDGSTTFNLPDFRGRVPAAPDNMGGTHANRITSLTFPDGADNLGEAGGYEAYTALTSDGSGQLSSGTGYKVSAVQPTLLVNFIIKA